MSKEVSLIGKALSDEGRVRVLAILKTQGKLCACDISEILNLTPATISRHMKVLLDAALVVSCKRGKWVYYSVPDLPSATHALFWSWFESTLTPEVRRACEQHAKSVCS